MSRCTGRTAWPCSAPRPAAVGALANGVRERLHGDRTFFNVNLHINATNVCEASCISAAFAA